MAFAFLIPGVFMFTLYDPACVWVIHRAYVTTVIYDRGNYPRWYFVLLAVILCSVCNMCLSQGAAFDGNRL